jgi:hypothetical protein
VKGKKQAVKPSKPEQKPETEKVESAAPQQPEVAAEPKKIDLNKPVVKEAIAQGQAIIKEGKSKADAARAIYAVLKDEDKDLIVAAFVKGATLTEKGALTYWYNCRRKAEKGEKKPAE